MVFLKSAYDTVRYSITAFCHVSVYTCHLLALKFEADKDYSNYRHQRSCQTHFSCCGQLLRNASPRKRISKAFLSSRSEGTMPVKTFECVYDLEDRPFLLFFECQNQFYNVDIISSNQKAICFSENKSKHAV